MRFRRINHHVHHHLAKNSRAQHRRDRLQQDRHYFRIHIDDFAIPATDAALARVT